MHGTLVVLLLAVWVGAVVVFVNVDRADRFLWIPILLAVAGVFSSILPFAVSFNIALVANGAALILFIVSLEVLKPKYGLAIAPIRHRARR